MIPPEGEISPEFVGCVLTCLSGGGIDDSRVVFMCLAGCYASTYLRDDRTDQDQEQDQSEDDDDDIAQLQEEHRRDLEEAEQQLEVVEGITPTYADRLREQGIESITDLAEADPETVAAVADISENQAGLWVDMARTRVQS